MNRTITISPTTRLEGHGKIAVFLDERGTVQRAFFQVQEFRGFERFCEGRLAEELPRIVPRICGVCPTAHHTASVKALDQMFGVAPTRAGRLIRELAYNAFLVEDHVLHFFFLGGPDFIMNPEAPPAERNILGAIGKLGRDLGRSVIDARRMCREILSTLGGKAVHPAFGLPGGVARSIAAEERARFEGYAATILQFCQRALRLFEEVVLKSPDYRALVLSDLYRHDTYSMGLVDEDHRLAFYDGKIRVVGPDGDEYETFDVRQYAEHIAEHVEPWSYGKFTYLKSLGWNGFKDGATSGIYGVGPLARLNVASGLSTPLADAEAQKMFETLGGKPSGLTLANHWARLIEALHAAERLREIAADPELTSPDIRNVPSHGVVGPGFGVVEAPRGTLIHHYEADGHGVVTRVNMIVATQNNLGRICLDVDKVAKALLRNGAGDEAVLNRVEMAFRAYDPCLGCATHALPGSRALAMEVYDSTGRLVRTLPSHAT